MRIVLALTTALTIATVIASGAACVDDREQVCTPNAVIECPCAGELAPGAQTCNADGTELSTCRCCTPGARRGCACMSAGKFGQQDCSSEGQWGSCYACQ